MLVVRGGRNSGGLPLYWIDDPSSDHTLIGEMLSFSKNEFEEKLSLVLCIDVDDRVSDRPATVVVVTVVVVGVLEVQKRLSNSVL